jgi:hypothetical protein
MSDGATLEPLSMMRPNQKGRKKGSPEKSQAVHLTGTHDAGSRGAH